MSAPILACALVDSIAPLLIEASISLGAGVEIGSAVLKDRRRVWHVTIVDDEYGTFTGKGETPSRALMEANTRRQVEAGQ